MVKTVLRKAYAPSVSSNIQQLIGKLKNEENIASSIAGITDTFWESGTFAQPQSTIRTESEMEATKIQAKTLLLTGKVFGVGGLKQICGNTNTAQVWIRRETNGLGIGEVV
jgi:hypothetical protein